VQFKKTPLSASFYANHHHTSFILRSPPLSTSVSPFVLHHAETSSRLAALAPQKHPPCAQTTGSTGCSSVCALLGSKSRSERPRSSGYVPHLLQQATSARQRSAELHAKPEPCVASSSPFFVILIGGCTH